jgi:hypothetical protein
MRSAAQPPMPRKLRSVDTNAMVPQGVPPERELDHINMTSCLGAVALRWAAP